LARPGGNITGLSNQTADIASKRVELLRELAGQVRRLAVLAKSGNASAASEVREIGAAAGPLGIDVVPIEIAQADDTDRPLRR
jgi:putative ABC transport system substrate-binding protein